jgi:phytochelatin synthase
MALTRTRKVLVSVGAAGVVLGGAAAAVSPLLSGDRADYSQVVSIGAAREFQDPALLEKAWGLPVAQLYRPGLEFQSNLSFCGPASMVNMMRSLGVAADQRTVLADTGVTTLLGMVPGGVTLDQLGDIARRKLGRTVTVLRDLDREAFRAHLRRVNDPSRRYVINFARGPLFGRGGGHHSPIAGYLAGEDLVLVLDVNSKYRPWLVRPDRLYQAMDTIDRSTGKKRGLLLVE